MRLLFMGTPEFAVPSLEACLELGEVVLVVTQPDRPRGRGQALLPPPVKALALARGLPVFQPSTLRDPSCAQKLRVLGADVAVVTAYGKLLPPDVLEAPARGSVNVHASLLPRWRGAAPIQRALEAGDAQTGVCLMQMDAGLDTGALISCASTPIGADDTSQSLHLRLGQLGKQLLLADLPRYLRGELLPTPQPSAGVTLARRVEREEGRLDFTRPAVELERRLRAFTPWPGAYTFLAGAGAMPSLLKVHRAKVAEGRQGAAPGTVLSAGPEGIEVACAPGALLLLEVQGEGKRRMSAAEFLSGRRLPEGSLQIAAAKATEGDG